MAAKSGSPRPWSVGLCLVGLVLLYPASGMGQWQWEKISAAGAPGARHSYAMAYHAATGKLIIQGGTYSSGGEAWDQWEFDGTSWSRRTFSTANPYEITDHVMAYDSLRKKSVIFGGWRSGFGNPYQDDTWIFDGTSYKKMDGGGPSGREKVGLAFDKKKKVIVLFGGYTGNERMGDTWTFNGVAWKKVKDTGPAARLLHVMAYDEKRKAVVLFGGYTNAGYNGETWIWKKNKWTKVSTTGPSARTACAMAYDPVAQRVILFGGRSGPWPNYVYHNDTWSWDGKKWTELAITGPSTRCSTRMAYMPSLGGLLLYGGDDPAAFSALADVWLLKH